MKVAAARYYIEALLCTGTSSKYNRNCNLHCLLTYKHLNMKMVVWKLGFKRRIYNFKIIRKGIEGIRELANLTIGAALEDITIS